LLPQKKAQKHKGHVKDTEQIKDRRETIMSVIRNKQRANIKDIATHIRGVSEKTIQRELGALIEAGMILKEGERRWSVYSLA
jgi:DeoR/GlpR family transcriptional regulator of sugar metabolism